jgi:excisionase family DNA binding protein
MTEEYLTVLAAAEYLDVSRDKISRMLKNGELTFIRDTLDKRQRLIPKSELDKVQRAGTVIKPSGVKKDPPANSLTTNAGGLVTAGAIQALPAAS